MSGGEQIVSANDMTDALNRVVNHGGQMVAHPRILPAENHVADLGVVYRDQASLSCWARAFLDKGEAAATLQLPARGCQR